jgi:uncharacterized membrane protein YoaT (DUF817 family)
MLPRVILLAQLLGTLAIFAWVPGNVWKTVAFLALWLATFWPITRRELLLYVGMSAFFAVLDAMSVSKGVFHFERPDIMVTEEAGLPLYELFMWGFYLLHGYRMLDGEPPPKDLPVTLVLVVLFAIPFVSIPNQQWLTVAAGTVLLIALIRYHAPRDLAYVAYFAGLGAAVEFVGVHAGEWSYPTPPAWGVPFWFLIMWGGVGLFARRLIQRWVYPPPSSEPEA